MPKRRYQPPFTLTSDLVTLVADIAQHLGRLSAQPDAGMDLRLRRINRIRTVTGSLAIEGNTLTEAQITLHPLHAGLHPGSGEKRQHENAGRNAGRNAGKNP